MKHYKMCSRGHELGPGNMTESGECLKCRREYSPPEPGVSNAKKTHCRYGHPLSGENLGTYTDILGSTHRYCKKCHALRGRSYYWNKMKALKHPNEKPGRPRKY